MSLDTNEKPDNGSGFFTRGDENTTPMRRHYQFHCFRKVPITGDRPSPGRRGPMIPLSGLFHKYGYVRGQGFFGQTRREQRAYPQRSVRREQPSLAEKERPPGGLRRIWPGAALLGRSSIAGDTLSPSRLASGQIGRNERDRIYETDHLARNACGNAAENDREDNGLAWPVAPPYIAPPRGIRSSIG